MTVHERIQIGNFRRRREGAFDAIYAEYGPRLYRFCLRLTARADDAEDLTQDVFVAALTGLDRFAERCSISTWLYRIALLRWRTKQRRQDAQSDDASLDVLGEHESLQTPDKSTSQCDRFDLERALSTLPQAHRDAFLLVKAETLSCREAGDVLQIPDGTVRYHVHRAIVALRRSVDLTEIAARSNVPDLRMPTSKSSSSQNSIIAVPADRRS